ncbi:hypothetical protein ASPZODRAFT_58952 [Penicilliopsis zonata CBS 506.65]|uniref:SMP-30/Gluconolactonase/LRE-like region domain-containing protein n=1 Tax=Penicilliopsis zonata CBS 506.65 TaxID=1073090 RepID=A0A1L9ST05_9EURO|nr:hypothetical protein ASPZODRAFT_58952 [Penicilliopsis zonata CBS 506.65]OJJ50338.1 hypothetical protein ASPZODRAFT_58952 [Penicilliopsis zonata CBS 506.65]
MSRLLTPTLTLTALSLLFTAVTATTTPAVQVNVLYSFGEDSWAENLAVRANGQILVSRLDTPEVLQLDPTGAREPITVAAWDANNYMGCLGISETRADVFYVVASGFVNDSFVLTSGVNTIWEIDMRTFAIEDDQASSGVTVTSNATVTKLVEVTSSDFLNGMTTFNETVILVADAYNGWVYAVDTTTGAYTVAVNETSMKFDSIVDPSTNLGVNGIKLHDGYLYWTNTAAGTLNRILLSDSHDDAVVGPLGPAETVVSNVPKADDFIFKSDGVAFIAQNQMDELSVLYPRAGHAEVIAGSNISTLLAGVSAGKFGRLESDAEILYLTTSGALGLPINGSVTVPATLSWINTSSF